MPAAMRDFSRGGGRKLEVLTFGAGDFRLAHSASECLPMADLMKDVGALAWFALLYPRDEQ